VAVVLNGNWDDRDPPTLEATFYVFDTEAAPDSIDRRPASVSLLFSELHEVQIGGLGYQNTIQGLGIHLERVERLRASCFRVNWVAPAWGTRCPFSAIASQFGLSRRSSIL
jgi:hypothetical protein